MPIVNIVSSGVRQGADLAGRSPRQRPRLTLRSQFTLVIFLLAFLPNLGITLLSPTGLTIQSLLWMTLVGLLSALTGYVLSGALLLPVSRLEAEVERGDFAEAHRDDPAEVRLLRRAFGGLLGRLSTEQARRNAFMATLVHDLKTPLIATGHLTQVLTTLPLPEAERREIGAQIQAETTRLLALVQQMADAHRFERDDVQLHLCRCDLRPILETVARRIAPRAAEKGVQVTLLGEGWALADAATLERAVGNLSENALRYAQHRLLLEVTPQGISVADDGPGLQGELTELAQPFNVQPTTIAGQQYTAGTAGLGLFIVRRIAEAHGGELRYQRRRLKAAEASASALLPDDTVTLFSIFTLSLPEVMS